MRIAFQLLTTLIFLALFPAIVLGTLIVGILAIWKKAKAKAIPPVHTGYAPAPPTVETTEASKAQMDSATLGGIDWAKVAICDPNKKTGTS